MRQLLRTLKYFFRRGRFESDLDEEIRYHLERKAEDSGAPADMRQFGNVTQIKEESRRMWTGIFWERFTQDLRYGTRSMAANPLFTAMAVASLALGIGANTAIYSFLDAILLRSLPVHRPEQLVVLNWRSPGRSPVIHGLAGSQFRDGKKGVVSPNFPYAAYQLLRTDQQSLSTLFAYATAWELNLVARKQADTRDAELVSATFFGDLGVPPAAGRLIGNEDDQPGAPPVVVLSYKYWESRYGADPSVAGQSILINRIPFTIIGVTSPGFFGLNPATEPAVYMPLHLAPMLAPNAAEDEQRKFFSRSFYWLEMMGRLRPGVTLEQAEAELAGRFHQYVESTVTSPKEQENLPVLWLENGSNGLDRLRRLFSEPLYILMAIVALILALTCANIANLSLARATSRRREMAVRLSLGASRFRVMCQLLTESILLSFTGALLGLLVAIWGIRSITWLLANGAEDFTLRASLDWQVLTFTLALAVVTGVVFGLAPAVQATKVDLTSGLKEVRAGASRGRSRRIGLSQLLVTAQVAISLLLVIGAGLFVRTISNLHSVELGFNRENILIFSMNARQAGYKDAALANMYGDLLHRFGHIPGVRSASLSQSPLATGYWHSTELTIPGTLKPAGPPLDTSILRVDPAFLNTLQIPMLAGRTISEHDLTSPRVAVVTALFATKFFPNQNPIGRNIGLGKGQPADIQIIGIAKTTHYNSIREDETPPVVYVPYTQDLSDLRQVFFQIRTAGDPLAIVNTVRQIVREKDSSIALSEVDTLAAHIDQTIMRERTFAQLCTCFAVLALIIACVGLYGTIAYAAAQRTSEIGIRMALGAERRRILWMVLSEVLLLVAIGITIGLGAAWGTTRFVESFLFGLKHNDPIVLTTSVLLLAAAALAAGYAPAWRASRINPITALRQE